MEKKVSINLGDLEIRSCGEHLVGGGNNLELVKWTGDSCYTIAYMTSEDIVLVGERPFELESTSTFWKLAKLMPKVYELLNEENENE